MLSSGDYALLGTLLGAGLKTAGDWFTELRVLRRERETRRLSRQWRLVEERNGQQRATLIEVQEQAVGLGQAVAALHILRKRGVPPGEAWHGLPSQDEAAVRGRAASARLTVLAARVRDRETRDLLFAVQRHYDMVARGLEGGAGEAALDQAQMAFASLNERIGDVLRDLDRADEATPNA
jgi:hypothetical protein